MLARCLLLKNVCTGAGTCPYPLHLLFSRCQGTLSVKAPSKSVQMDTVTITEQQSYEGNVETPNEMVGWAQNCLQMLIPPDGWEMSEVLSPTLCLALQLRCRGLF